MPLISWFVNFLLINYVSSFLTKSIWLINHSTLTSIRYKDNFDIWQTDVDVFSLGSHSLYPRCSGYIAVDVSGLISVNATWLQTSSSDPHDGPPKQRSCSVMQDACQIRLWFRTKNGYQSSRTVRSDEWWIELIEMARKVRIMGKE